MNNIIRNIDPDIFLRSSLSDKLFMKANGTRPKPIVLPEREWKYYNKITSTRPRYLKRLQSIWAKHKKKIAFAYAKEKQFLSSKSIFYKQQSDLDKEFDTLQNDLEEEALLMIEEGLFLGNSYFEDTFRISGLSDSEIAVLKEQALQEFHENSTQLFKESVLDKLENRNINSLEEATSVLNTFDYLLLAYAGIASALAYQIFSNTIAQLNDELTGKLSDTLFEISEKPFAVRWILGDTENHSDDCVRLSQGSFTLNGYGVWDADELSSQDLYPRSPNLDCGGNCLCHLSPVENKQSSLIEDLLLNQFLESDEFSFATTLSSTALLSLLSSNTNISGSLLESLGLDLFSLNDSPWESLFDPGFRKQATAKTPLYIEIHTEETASWEISLSLNTLRTGNIQSVRKIDVNIYNPYTSKTIPSFVQKTLSHALDGVAARTFLYQTPEYISNILSETEIQQLKILAESEYYAAIRKLEMDFIATLQTFTSPNFSTEETQTLEYFKQNDLSLSELVQDPQGFPIVVTLMKKMGLGKNLVSFQQLASPSDYLAEYITLWMRNPTTARVMNSRLLLGLQRILPARFGVVESGKKTLKLPNNISIDQRLDVPVFKPAVVLPHIGGFSSTIPTENVEVRTTKIKKDSALRQLRRTIDSNFALQRPEYFQDIQFIFVSKLQMKRITGRNKDIISLEYGSDNVFININQWKFLSKQKNIELLAEIAFNNIWKHRIKKTKVREIYKKYIEATFFALETKFLQFGLPINDLQVLHDQVSSDIIKWNENWNSISNILKNIPDLPIMKLISLYSTKDFFRVFFVNYITRPQTALQYFGEELYFELRESLEIK